jgi:site-specific recombinase XerD
LLVSAASGWSCFQAGGAGRAGHDQPALLATTKGRGFLEVRDAAILRLLIDTGLRRAELTGLTVDDLDLDHEVAIVLGKGRRGRALPFGKKTAMALDRYLRARSRHANADRPELWLTQKGHLTNAGLAKMLQRRYKAGEGSGGTPASVPAHVRPRVAVRGRQRG